MATPPPNDATDTPTRKTPVWHRKGTMYRKSFWMDVDKSSLGEEERLARSVGLPVLQPTLRSSGISDFRECPRKFMYRYRLGLSSTGYRSALHIGHYYHEIMATLYSGSTLTRALNVAESLRDYTLNGARKTLDSTGYLPNGVPWETFETKAQKDYALGCALASWAWDQDPLDFDEWEPIMVEKLIEVRIARVPTPIRIRVDALLRRRSTGDLYFVDHKTTSMSTLDRSASLLWDMQPRLYRLALDAALTGTPDEGRLCGVVHNIIKKPGIRQKQKETFHEYLDRVATTLSDNLASAALSKTPPPFLRSTIKFITPSLTEELLMVLREMSKASKCALHIGRFPRNAHACFNWNTPCEYMPMCSSPMPAWGQLIDARYRVVSRDEEDETFHDWASNLPAPDPSSITCTPNTIPGLGAP